MSFVDLVLILNDALGNVLSRELILHFFVNLVHHLLKHESSGIICVALELLSILEDCPSSPVSHHRHFLFVIEVISVEN